MNEMLSMFLGGTGYYIPYATIDLASIIFAIVAN